MAAGHERRLRALELRALELRAPAVVARADSMTLAEWVQWRKTGQQPERWLHSPAIQAQVREQQARHDAVEQMMRAFEGDDYEQDGSQAEDY